MIEVIPDLQSGMSVAFGSTSSKAFLPNGGDNTDDSNNSTNANAGDSTPSE